MAPFADRAAHEPIQRPVFSVLHVFIDTLRMIVNSRRAEAFNHCFFRRRGGDVTHQHRKFSPSGIHHQNRPEQELSSSLT